MAKKAETLVLEEPAVNEAAGVPVKAVKIKAFKVETSRCMALEDDVLDLPIDEADALIAKGDAEAV